MFPVLTENRHLVCVNGWTRLGVLADLSFTFDPDGQKRPRLDWGMHLVWIDNEHAEDRGVAMPEDRGAPARPGEGQGDRRGAVEGQARAARALLRPVLVRARGRRPGDDALHERGSACPAAQRRGSRRAGAVPVRSAKRATPRRKK